ncbi:MAG TPA: DUF4249 domain-containing protein [Chitinophagaceae bacterium]
MNCRLFLLLSLLVVMQSCERTIEIELDDVNPKLVVEAVIENDEAPVVYLTKSVDYFSKIDLDTLVNSFVHNADVFISNGVLTHKLKEYAVPVGNGLFFHYYSIDSANLATAFSGELSHTYSLRILHEGREYTSTTTIPNITKRIDSLYWKQATGSNPPQKVSLMLRATDPAGLGDYIRYFTKQNSKPFYPGLNSVFDDQLIDNSTYDVQVEKGVSRNVSQPEDYAFFDKGDTVTLKLSNIDKATYDFWRTMEFTYLSVGNPFSAPTRVLSNISNNALGYFGGYASQYKTIIIPK